MKVSRIRAFSCALITAVFLGYVSGHQLLGTSRDYENYIIFFDWLKSTPANEIFSYRFEPGFILLAAGLATLQITSTAIYTCIASITIFLKYIALQSTRNFWPVFAALTLYYAARYFTLFEMTVLRATIALSLAFLAFYTRTGHEYRTKDLLLLLAAVSIHYSAIVFIPIYLIRPLNRTTIIALGAASFITIFATKNIALALLPDYVPVFGTYQELTKATLLPIPFAVDIVFFCFVLLNWRKNDALMKTCALGMAIGIAFHFSLLEYSLLAGRFREILSLFYLLFVVRAVGCARSEMKYATVAYAAVSAALHLYAGYVHDPLLT